MGQIKILEITSNDTEAYQQLRLDMVKLFPLSFDVCLDELEERSFKRWENDVNRILHNPDANRFFARTGELTVGMVGVIVFRDNPSSAEIGSMYVIDELQGQGIGGRLLEAAVGFSKQRGAASISLWVHEGNQTAIRFYETHGFQLCNPLASKKRYDDNGVELKMTKLIVE